MWNFARTQTRSSQRSETIEAPTDRDLNKIFGNLFEPLEPPTPRREPFESVPLTAVAPPDAGDAAADEEMEDLTDNAA
ncbi:MAG: hypothetical protein ABI186_07495 [Candidatus Elarobacter sp.]